jgi:hypothetical protein
LQIQRFFELGAEPIEVNGVNDGIYGWAALQVKPNDLVSIEGLFYLPQSHQISRLYLYQLFASKWIGSVLQKQNM